MSGSRRFVHHAEFAAVFIIGRENLDAVIFQRLAVTLAGDFGIRFQNPAKLPADVPGEFAEQFRLDYHRRQHQGDGDCRDRETL